MIYHYTLEDLKKAFEKLNLKSNDNVFIFSSLGNLGILKKSKSLEDICKKLWIFLKDYFSQGTIFVPAYSYTLGKNLLSQIVIFDPNSTKPEIGPLPEFVYKQEGVVRSLDPMMSICGYGKYANYVLENIPNNSYGPDSPFERLLEIPNAKCLTLGLDVEWLPYIHYIDYLFRVPFRYEKLFVGIIKNKKEIKKIPWIYSVRCRLENSEPDAKPIGKLAEKQGIWKKEIVGRSFICACDLKEYFKFIKMYMEKNPWSLAKGPEINVEEGEKERVKIYLENGIQSYKLPKINFLSDSSTFEGIREFENICSKFNRFLTSNDLDEFLKSLAKTYNFEIVANFKTGDYLFGWILPEGWVYKDSYIKLGSKKIKLFPYIYSYPLKKIIKTDKKDLFKYFRISMGLNENEIYFCQFINEKDHGFNISKKQFVEILKNLNKEGKIEVNIDTNFYYKKYIYLKKLFKGKTNNKLVFIAFANGPYKVNENISSLLTLLAFNYEIENKYKNLLRHNIEFIITYEKFGFLLWLYDNINNLDTIDSIIILNNLSNPQGILSIYGNSNFSKFIQTSVKREKCNFYSFIPMERIYQMGPVNLKPYEWNILNILQEKITLISYDYPYGLETYPADYINTNLDNQIENKSEFFRRIKNLIKFLVIYEDLGGYYV